LNSKHNQVKCYTILKIRKLFTRDIRNSNVDPSQTLSNYVKEIKNGINYLIFFFLTHGPISFTYSRTKLS
ncbi:unnamed protein product, partial [Arabidopsis halleri]